MSTSENNVLANLKIIGLVQIYERIYTKYNPVIIPNTYWSSFLRTLFMNDDRQKLFIFLEKTLNDSEYIIKKLIIDSRDIQTDLYLKEVINDYYQSQIGLSNLTQTYKSDNHYVCQLNVMIRKCKKFIIEEIPEIEI